MQRIRVTREAHIELLAADSAAEARKASATGERAATAAPLPAKDSSSLAEYLVWEGVFVTPADAGAYCLSLSQGLRPQQIPGSQTVSLSSQQDSLASTPHVVPWISSWINRYSSDSCGSSNSCGSERIIPAGSVEAGALSCEASSPSTQTNRSWGLKKAFLMAHEAAAASTAKNRRQNQAETCSNKPGIRMHPTRRAAPGSSVHLAPHCLSCLLYCLNFAKCCCAIICSVSFILCIFSPAYAARPRLRTPAGSAAWCCFC